MTPMHLVVLSAREDYARNIIEPVSAELAMQGVVWSVTTDHSALDETSDMVFLLGYDKIVDAKTIAKLRGRLAVFHSSDLPKGRGWAPIYTTIASQATVHTVTLCYANQAIDAGNILLKARIPVPAYYTGAMLRSVGQRVIGQLISRYARRFNGNLPPGIEPQGESSYVPRRKPEDAEMEVDKSLSELMPHILASEQPNAACLTYRGEKFRIIAVPERQDIRADFRVEEYFGATLEHTITFSL